MNSYPPEIRSPTIYVKQMQLLTKTLSMLSLLALFVLVGCGGPGGVTSDEYQQIVERIREIVGDQLDLNVGEVDVHVPFSKQKKAADELDVVEIVMKVEDAFNIEIEDEEASKDLSVEKLADIVSKKKSRK